MVSVERVLAPNPSPMTLEGTNTYLVFGGREAIAIDPGPPLAAHVDAIVAKLSARSATLAAIVLTHDHPDHAPAALLLRTRTAAPIYAHAESRLAVDHRIGEGDRVTAGEAVLTAIETPGHARDHLVFSLAEERALFTGDVVVGRGTVVIAPPNGDMRAYQATLERLRREHEDARTIYGGHGEPVGDPRSKLDEYIAHRRAREHEILAQLATGEKTVPELVAEIYRAVPVFLWPAAARQVLAHLIALEREGRVRARNLGRAPSAAETTILNPDLSRIVDADAAAVVRAELGFDTVLTGIEAYSLADA